MVSIFPYILNSSSDLSSMCSSFINCKDFLSFELWIPFNVLSAYLYGFSLLTLIYTGFGSKLLTRTRIIVLLGKKFVLWMDQTIFSWIYPNLSFLPWGTIKYNLQIKTSSLCFFIDSTKIYSIGWLPHCSELPICSLITFLVL
jgi:hypothetical protein